MLKMVFLVFAIIMFGGIVSHAEDWQQIGSPPEARFQKLVDEFYRKLSVGDKDDVIKALRNNKYEVYVDEDSIKEGSDGRRKAKLKTIFIEEQKMQDTDKKFKFIIAEMSFDCAEEVLWFLSGETYDKDGVLLRDSQTVYVPVVLKDLPGNSTEIASLEFVCKYKIGQ